MKEISPSGSLVEYLSESFLLYGKGDSYIIYIAASYKAFLLSILGIRVWLFRLYVKLLD